MFDMSADNFTKWTHKIVVGKKLGDQVTENWHKAEDMQNELDCDSNDYVRTVSSVFTFWTVRLTCK